MDVGGGDLTQLTDTPGQLEFVPTWSPDSARIVYDFTPAISGDIWVMNVDGSFNRQLTTNSANDTHPFFSPDGTEILFTSARDGDHEIFVMNANGTNIRQLTFNTFSDFSYGWSPDGTRIVFNSDRDGDREVYVMNRDGTNQTPLTDNLEDDTAPSWAPRKGGVEVSEESVVIPNSSALLPMTPQDVTANDDAVVRIETDLGSGSGIIFDPGGFILTNNHVITDASEITVFLVDGTSHTGTVQGRDLVRDLAVVKIEASGLPTLEIGDISQVSLGQQVLVLGFPLGSENIIVTSGLLSSTDVDSGRNILWLQTDSAINPGNSGGPLLNLQGQVIGVVTAKFVDVSIENVGFAISANTVKLHLDRLKAGEIIAN